MTAAQPRSSRTVARTQRTATTRRCARTGCPRRFAAGWRAAGLVAILCAAGSSAAAVEAETSLRSDASGTSGSTPTFPPVERSDHAPPIGVDAPSWRMQPATDGVPYRLVHLAGTVRIADRTDASVLSIGCRHDDPPVLNISFSVPDVTGIDVERYEGPEGIGQARALLRFDDGGGSRLLRVGGWWSAAGTFTFAPAVPLHPEVVEALGNAAIEPAGRRGTDSGGRWLFELLEGEDAKAPLLAAHFNVPTDPSALRGAIRPCLEP